MDPGTSGFNYVYEGQILDARNRMYSFVLTEVPSAAFKPGEGYD